MAAKRSRRKQQALEAQLAVERRRRLRIGGLVALAVIVIGGLLWAANRPTAEAEDIPELAWGPADAPVVVEEWSDFN